MTFWRWAVGILAPTLLGCAQAHVPPEKAPAHDTFELASRHTGETRVVNVYLPPGYAPEGQGGGYPTLYLPDGGVNEDFPHLATALDAGIRAGRVRPMLLVGIENTDRRRDMTGPTTVASDRDSAPRVGGSAAYRAFLAEELIPAIEARYRVDESRGIIGESAAGLFIVETLFLQPGLFDTHIAFSPSLWWNDARLVKDARLRMASEPRPRGRLFVASANEENIVPHVAALAEALASDAPEGLYWVVRPRPDLRHDTLFRTLAPELLAGYYASVTPQDAATGPVRRDGEPTLETE